MSAGRGRPMGRVPSGPGTAMARFLLEAVPKTGLTNSEIAERLGYSRQNIVSMWKAGRTKVTLDRVFALSDLLGVDKSYVLALWIDQYVSEWSGVDSFPEIVSVLQRIVTPEEMALIQSVRAARKGGVASLSPEERDAVASLLSSSSATSSGPYKPIETVVHPFSGDDRRRFARRGGTSDAVRTALPSDDGERLREAQLAVRISESVFWATSEAALQKRVTTQVFVLDVLSAQIDGGTRPEWAPSMRTFPLRSLGVRTSQDLRYALKLAALDARMKVADYVEATLAQAVQSTKDRAA